LGDEGDGDSSWNDGNRKRRKSSKEMSKKSKSRQSKTDSLDSHQKPAEQTPLSDLIEIYCSTLQNVAVGKVLDPMFPAARMAWDRMRRQYPQSGTIGWATFGAAFEDMAATVYEEVAAAHPQADEQELSGKLESRLFNASQITVKRAEVEKASQSARETSDEFSDRVRQLEGCLSDATPDAVLCSRFLNGVSVGLRREATIADRGNFDELVSTVARLAAVGRRKTEYVSELQEHPRRSPAFAAR
jgi:hypothetical protein